jgi:hypothetical protein
VKLYCLCLLFFVLFFYMPSFVIIACTYGLHEAWFVVSHFWQMWIVTIWASLFFYANLEFGEQAGKEKR